MCTNVKSDRINPLHRNKRSYLNWSIRRSRTCREYMVDQSMHSMLRDSSWMSQYYRWGLHARMCTRFRLNARRWCSIVVEKEAYIDDAFGPMQAFQRATIESRKDSQVGIEIVQPSQMLSKETHWIVLENLLESIRYASSSHRAAQGTLAQLEWTSVWVHSWYAMEDRGRCQSDWYQWRIVLVHATSGGNNHLFGGRVLTCFWPSVRRHDGEKNKYTLLPSTASHRNDLIVPQILCRSVTHWSRHSLSSNRLDRCLPLRSWETSRNKSPVDAANSVRVFEISPYDRRETWSFVVINNETALPVGDIIEVFCECAKIRREVFTLLDRHVQDLWQLNFQKELRIQQRQLFADIVRLKIE